MVKIDISDFIIAKTTKCKRDFKCLSGNNSCMCEVLESGKVTTVKLKAKPESPCPYCYSFNTFHYCLCPTRNEIYKKYKK